MRARGKERGNVASFALVRDGICVRVCVHRIASRAAPSCRVASLRRVQARAETGDCTLICPARPPATSGRKRTVRDVTRAGRVKRDFGFRISDYPVPHTPTLLISKTSILCTAGRGPVTFMIELGAPRLYCGRYPLKFSLLTFSRAESSLGRGDAPAKGADHQMAHPAPE